MANPKVWVEINSRGLPRSAVGERPKDGNFERYYPESEVVVLRERISELEARTPQGNSDA